MTSIDTRWEQQFVLALRSRDVSGAAIGSALAEVQSHCAETGESPQEAFGPALAYAASLGFPARAILPRLPALSTSILGACAITGLWIFPDAAGALLRGDQLTVTKGWLLAIVAIVLVVAGAVVSASAAVRRPAIAWGFLAAYLAFSLVPMLLWRTPAFTTNPVLPTLLTGTLLIGGALGLYSRRDLELENRLVDPVTGEQEQLPRALSHSIRYAPLTFIIAGLSLAVLSWLAGGH